MVSSLFPHRRAHFSSFIYFSGFLRIPRTTVLKGLDCILCFHCFRGIRWFPCVGSWVIYTFLSPYTLIGALCRAYKFQMRPLFRGKPPHWPMASWGGEVLCTKASCSEWKDPLSGRSHLAFSFFAGRRVIKASGTPWFKILKWEGPQSQGLRQSHFGDPPLAQRKSPGAQGTLCSAAFLLMRG